MGFFLIAVILLFTFWAIYRAKPLTPGTCCPRRHPINDDSHLYQHDWTGR